MDFPSFFQNHSRYKIVSLSPKGIDGKRLSGNINIEALTALFESILNQRKGVGSVAIQSIMLPDVSSKHDLNSKDGSSNVSHPPQSYLLEILGKKEKKNKTYRYQLETGTLKNSKNQDIDIPADSWHRLNTIILNWLETIDNGTAKILLFYRLMTLIQDGCFKKSLFNDKRNECSLYDVKDRFNIRGNRHKIMEDLRRKFNPKIACHSQNDYLPFSRSKETAKKMNDFILEPVAIKQGKCYAIFDGGDSADKNSFPSVAVQAIMDKLSAYNSQNEIGANCEWVNVLNKDEISIEDIKKATQSLEIFLMDIKPDGLGDHLGFAFVMVVALDSGTVFSIGRGDVSLLFYSTKNNELYDLFSYNAEYSSEKHGPIQAKSVDMNDEMATSWYCLADEYSKVNNTLNYGEFKAPSNGIITIFSDGLDCLHPIHGKAPLTTTNLDGKQETKIRNFSKNNHLFFYYLFHSFKNKLSFNQMLEMIIYFETYFKELKKDDRALMFVEYTTKHNSSDTLLSTDDIAQLALSMS